MEVNNLSTVMSHTHISYNSPGKMLLELIYRQTYNIKQVRIV